MAEPNDIPTLADLRRKPARRSVRPAPPELPLLFALSEVESAAPAVEPQAAPLLDEALPLTIEEVLPASRRPQASLRKGPAPDEPEPEEPEPGDSEDEGLEEESAPRVWSVSELVSQVRGLVERSYAQVAVDGEISNWRPAASGHCYFTLKDGQAQLAVVMFRRQASMLRFRPRDGDAVRLYGQLSVYESRGQMQLIAEWMQQQGLGALLAAVRELKERLRREGLFDRKRVLPPFPHCIGVVTSAHGAALRDIVKVCRRRHAAVRLLIYPAAVQGPNCAREVAAGVRWFSAHPELVDVVIVARGGGSWEDLHGFDDEGVARAIAASAVPVVTGIGHATDTTIADAAADLAAPTPSAAAELVTAGQHGLKQRVDQLRQRLERAGKYEILHARQRLSRVTATAALRRARESVDRRGQRVDEMSFRAEAAVARLLQQRTERVMRLEARLRQQHPALRLAGRRRGLELLTARLHAALRSPLQASALRVERAALRLQALSPLRVLERGYALVYGPDGTLLRTSGRVMLGERITARLADGSVSATIFAKRTEEETTRK